MTPLTIGLPVYNGERFLEQALGSILGQTFADFSLVVSDNASTDGTMEILEAHADRDDRIVIFTKRDQSWLGVELQPRLRRLCDTLLQVGRG